MSRDLVARLAGVAPAEVQQVDAVYVRQALADRVASIVLDVATAYPATYWLANGQVWLDDPEFHDHPVSFAELDYDEDLGLHIRRGI